MPPRPADFDDNRAVWTLGHEGYQPEVPLVGELLADVVIIGGGFTGTSTAWQLSQRFPDRKIVLLEAKTLANGASGRNGGQMLHWCNGVGYSDPEVVRRVYDATDQGIRWIVDTIREHKLPVRYRMDGTFELTTAQQRVDEAGAHAEKLQSWGIPIEFLTGDALRQKVDFEGVCAGIFDPHTGLLNGADFVRALKPLLLARGVSIYENTLVTRIVEGDTLEVQCAGGTVRAPALVLATNGYTGKLGYFQNQVLPMHSHMVATAPADAESWAQLGWGKADAFCDDLDRIAYGGLSPEGQMLFGGGSNRSYSYRYGGPTAVPLDEGACDAVEARLRGYLPRAAALPVTHRWSGVLGITLDRKCAMGVRGEHKNIYYALGYSGHGVALANLAGQVLCDLYSDHHEPWQKMPFYQNALYWFPPEPLRWLGYKAITTLTGKSPRRHT